MTLPPPVYSWWEATGSAQFASTALKEVPGLVITGSLDPVQQTTPIEQTPVPTSSPGSSLPGAGAGVGVSTPQPTQLTTSNTELTSILKTSSDLTPSSSSTSTPPQANRQRLGQNTHPEQYVGDPMAERPPGRQRKLHIAPFGSALASARRDQRRVEAAVESEVDLNDWREDGTGRDEALAAKLKCSCRLCWIWDCLRGHRPATEVKSSGYGPCFVALIRSESEHGVVAGCIARLRHSTLGQSL
ncbi:hypothetical protein B0H14DRAFT_2570355 [Mycena olivaceomarginata]|nr:hypothetical protein B0H14DRAFT_2570355 [Mycena olivaceomarginata]